MGEMVFYKIRCYSDKKGNFSEVMLGLYRDGYRFLFKRNIPMYTDFVGASKLLSSNSVQIITNRGGMSKVIKPSSFLMMVEVAQGGKENTSFEGMSVLNVNGYDFFEYDSTYTSEIEIESERVKNDILTGDDE